MRELILATSTAVAVFFGREMITKENIVVLVVGLLTFVGLVRVLTNEVSGTSEKLFGELTNIAERYYAFRKRLRDLRRR